MTDNPGTPDPVADGHAALGADLGELLDPDAGLREVLLAADHRRLGDDLTDLIDVDAGLRAIAPDTTHTAPSAPPRREPSVYSATARFIEASAVADRLVIRTNVGVRRVGHVMRYAAAHCLAAQLIDHLRALERIEPATHPLWIADARYQRDLATKTADDLAITVLTFVDAGLEDVTHFGAWATLIHGGLREIDLRDDLAHQMLEGATSGTPRPDRTVLDDAETVASELKARVEQVADLIQGWRNDWGSAIHGAPDSALRAAIGADLDHFLTQVPPGRPADGPDSTAMITFTVSPQSLTLLASLAVCDVGAIDPQRQLRGFAAAALTAANELDDALDDFTAADLTDVDLGRHSLEGLRWSAATRWPSPEWRDRAFRDSVRAGPGVFVIRHGSTTVYSGS